MSWTGFGVDEDPGPHEYLNFKTILSALRTALDSAGIAKFDFIGFDACLMASMEMIAMLEPYANIYIGSEDLEPGHGWNYQYFERLYDTPYGLTGQKIAEVLWDSFFNEGTDVPTTLSVIDLTKVAPFVAAVEALASVLVKELSTPGVLLGFIQAADTAYFMGSKDFVDFGHFLRLLKDKLPRQDYKTTSYDELCAKIDGITGDNSLVWRDLFVKERHSDDVPNAYGLNIFLPKTDAKWIKWSKLYYLLWGYTDWHYLVGYVYGVRSGDITDSFLATDLLSWKDAIASVEAGATNASVSRYLSEGSMPNAVSAKLRYGVQVGIAPDDVTYWLGQAPAQLQSSGLVTAAWSYKVLTVVGATVTCAVYHEMANSESELAIQFYVAYYKVGAPVERAIGTYSSDLGRWTLYSNKSTGIAEIAKTESIAWLVPLVQDSDGRLVETTATDCKSGLMYTT